MKRKQNVYSSNILQKLAKIKIFASSARKNLINILPSFGSLPEQRMHGQKYKIGSLETTRYSLNRVLKRYGHKFDITKRECTAFTASIKAYDDATTEMKQEGKGFTKNHAAVSLEDLYDIYHSRHLDPDAGPRALQNKVQWDIRFYFARRGSENMYNMTKTTFTIKMDEKTGMQYVVKVEDEATKNHKQNEHDIVTGYMPAINDDKYCPVKSFI
ncbi:threonine dehydratase biosynthetic, chloroplastic [Paramuricea clavata]|uniref:Threonine dehydratase biosynthetic, chloroplastic n=1 Tax=Paramuricea clavata TaxID=317549 RepID=A0A6S7JA24_PARCT|nr:threonine dehydratase biosynthetic, chloroplastic [Paramuricea clavata]